MKETKKKRVLKSWVQKVLSFILGSWSVWICTTIDTIDLRFDKIKGYLIFTSILTILSVVSFYLLFKYSKIFED